MKKGFMIIALMASLALMGCNGGNSASKEKVESQYKVVLGEAKKVTSKREGYCLAVNYSFTNNSDEAVAADTALLFKAYQDGVQIDSVFDSQLTGDNESKSIKPGASLACVRLFKNVNKSDVEVEVKEFMGADESIATKTYKVE